MVHIQKKLTGFCKKTVNTPGSDEYSFSIVFDICIIQTEFYVLRDSGAVKKFASDICV